MSQKKFYQELNTYKIFQVNFKEQMKEKNISQNILSKITNLSVNTIRSYYHGNIKRVDLDVISRICEALNCEINDIIKRK